MWDPRHVASTSTPNTFLIDKDLKFYLMIQILTMHTYISNSFWTKSICEAWKNSFYKTKIQTRMYFYNPSTKYSTCNIYMHTFLCSIHDIEHRAISIQCLQNGSKFIIHSKMQNGAWLMKMEVDSPRTPRSPDSTSKTTPISN